MICGLQAAKDFELSSITPPLNEAIPLIKMEDWLSRNLDNEEFTGWINEKICRLGSAKIADEVVIASIPVISKRHLPNT